MAVRFDTQKFGQDVLEVYKKENRPHIPDWNKPVYYKASGGYIDDGFLKTMFEEFEKYLQNPKAYKPGKQRPEGSFTIVKVLKKRSYDKFDPIAVTQVGRALGFTYGHVTVNSAMTEDNNVVVLCY
ncbi:MAG: hypothetical protein N4A57_08700 [Anaeromicrobium sp.]|jgi:hypothetical protein|uniref:hypothetical protein n=1 Tax=Anaeromicrobium sp. TaxID=1929132 RepID=UPI0025EA5AB8|nr:hypothetical protein [Anaeromicrobium sp.]MCT4594330.1 hypothetical protein [Anaeromicrobium sp.]